MRPGMTRPAFLILVVSLFLAQSAQSQWFPERSEECDAHICVQTGESNWRSDVSLYCEADICLRDRLDGLVDLGWSRISAGADFLASSDERDFIGLSSTEFQQLREFGDEELEERVRLLGKVQATCQLKHFTLELSLPGRNSATVTFATPIAVDGGFQGFQVIKVDRRYRIGTSRTGSWMRWIHYRFPGIDRIDGRPREFANYEMGLYVGSVVLFDKEFEVGQAEDYAKHPDCEAR